MPATSNQARKSAPKKAPAKKAPTKRQTAAQKRAQAERAKARQEYVKSLPATPTPVVHEEYQPTTWGKTPNAAIIPLDVPSGQTCLVRTVGMQGLMAVGILDEVDGLTAIVDEKYIRARKGQNAIEIDAVAMAEDSDAVNAIFKVVNKVVCYCVMEPRVEPVPTIQDSEGNWVEDADPAARVPGVVYIDTVPEEDQMFIFNAVLGGTRDLEQFRQLSQDALGGLGVSPDVEANA